MLNTETFGGGKKTFFRRVRCVKMSEAVFIFVLKTFLGAPPLPPLLWPASTKFEDLISSLSFQAQPMEVDCLLYLSVSSRLNSVKLIHPRKLFYSILLVWTVDMCCALKLTKQNKKPPGSHDGTFDWQTS